MFAYVYACLWGWGSSVCVGGWRGERDRRGGGGMDVGVKG